MANDPQVVPIHTTLPVWQKAMLDRYGREKGMLTLAETLRQVLTKAADAGILTPPPPQEQPA